MKKMLIAGLILFLCSVTFAATVITYNIPNDIGKELLDALVATSNCHIRIEAWTLGTAGEEEERWVIDFTTPEYDPNTAPTTFVKKRVALFAMAIRQMHKRKLKTDIRETYLADAPE